MLYADVSLYKTIILPVVVNSFESVQNLAAAVQVLARRPAILTEVLHGFPQSLQASTGIVPEIRPGPLPSNSFAIYSFVNPIIRRYIV
jgi:hypothetical protein